MGLDVYITRNDEPILWKDGSTDTFPFKPTSEAYTDYDCDGNEIGEYTYEYIPGICGMLFSPEYGISFRGKGYSYFAKAINLPHSFYDNMTKEEVKEQYEALQAYLAPFSGMSKETLLPPESLNVKMEEEMRKSEAFFMPITEVQSLQEATNLCTLLKWVVDNGFGFYASYQKGKT